LATNLIIDLGGKRGAQGEKGMLGGNGNLSNEYDECGDRGKEIAKSNFQRNKIRLTDLGNDDSEQNRYTDEKIVGWELEESKRNLLSNNFNNRKLYKLEKNCTKGVGKPMKGPPSKLLPRDSNSVAFGSNTAKQFNF
jgi:hypothetical protein